MTKEEADRICISNKNRTHTMLGLLRLCPASSVLYLENPLHESEEEGIVQVQGLQQQCVLRKKASGVGGKNIVFENKPGSQII